MMMQNMQLLIDHYRPLLTALFEYYLYEAYLPTQTKKLGEACLPYFTIAKFYADFASGESIRLNRTTFNETIANICNIAKHELEDWDPYAITKTKSASHQTLEHQKIAPKIRVNL